MSDCSEVETTATAMAAALALLHQVSPLAVAHRLIVQQRSVSVGFLLPDTGNTHVGC